MFLSLVFVRKPYSDKVFFHLSQLEEENYSFGAASLFFHLFLFFPSNTVMVMDEQVPKWSTKGQLGCWVTVSVQSCVSNPGFSFPKA